MMEDLGKYVNELQVAAKQATLLAEAEQELIGDWDRRLGGEGWRYADDCLHDEDSGRSSTQHRSQESYRVRIR